MRLEGAPFTPPGGEMVGNVPDVFPAIADAYETGRKDGLSDRKRRTRILALDAAARVWSGQRNPVMTYNAPPNQHFGHSYVTAVPVEGASTPPTSEQVIAMARDFEKYIDGEDSP